MRRLSPLIPAAAALLGAGLLFGPPGHAATPVAFYVSPTGSDTNSGTSASSPFKTLTKAQSAVRGVAQATSGPVTVNLAGGDYRLSTPLSIVSNDSGTNGDIWWQAEPGAFPVVSGAAKITGWNVSNPRNNIWSAPAPASLPNPAALRQRRPCPARERPATGVNQTSTGYTTASGDPMAGWRDPGHVEFVYPGGLGAWTEPRCPVASITGTTITMAQPCWDNSTKRVMPPTAGPHLEHGRPRRPRPTAPARPMWRMPSSCWTSPASGTSTAVAHRSTTSRAQASTCARADVEAPVLQQLVTPRTATVARCTTSPSRASSSPTPPGSPRPPATASPRSRPATPSPARPATRPRACASSSRAAAARTATGPRKPATSLSATTSDVAVPTSDVRAPRRGRPRPRRRIAGRHGGTPACSPTSPATASRSAASTQPTGQRGPARPAATRSPTTTSTACRASSTAASPSTSATPSTTLIAHNQIDHVAYTAHLDGLGRLAGQDRRCRDAELLATTTGLRQPDLRLHAAARRRRRHLHPGHHRHSLATARR